MKATDQIKKAEKLGATAFNNNAMCVPALDRNLLNMLAGRGIGETPKGEASTIRLLKSWTGAWHNENAKGIEF